MAATKSKFKTIYIHGHEGYLEYENDRAEFLADHPFIEYDGDHTKEYVLTDGGVHNFWVSFDGNETQWYSTETYITKVWVDDEE